ncbi:MAG: acetoacetate decarboxylase family protein [Candidatus Helarchaeota archaeon]|nr:acetoacetate decarboxylase family protein [Candidatus Helarchaeota archaeon]
MKFVLDDKDFAKLTSVEGPLEGKFFDAEIVLVSFLTDRKTIKRIIPRPLKPASPPTATAFVAKYPKTNFECVYNEAALSLNVEYKGEPGSYCLSMPVTDDMAMIGGREIYGFPKKIAEKISLDATETGVNGSCVRRGTELINLSMDFEQEVDKEDLLKLLNPGGPKSETWEAVNYLFKYFIAPDGSGFDYKPRLVRQVSSISPVKKIKLSSKFELNLKSSNRDFLGEIPVKSPIMGAYGFFNMTMHLGKVVAEVDEFSFMPYAFSKVDFVISEDKELTPEAKH